MCLYVQTYFQKIFLIPFNTKKDYSEEFRDIIGVKTKKSAVTENGITLVNQHKYDEELPVNVFYFLFIHFTFNLILF